MSSDQDNDAHGQVVRSATAVSAAVMVSRVTGLAREFVFASFFGASLVYDAYYAAYRVPNLFRDLLAEGALSSAFVTTFSKRLSTGGEREAFELANRLTTVLAPLTAFVSLLAFLFAPQILHLLAPGFAETPGKMELAILLARIMAPFLVFIALAAKALGVLNAKGRFAAPALSSACFNVTSVAFGLAIGFLAGPALGIQPIVGMAIGTVIGGFAQYAWQWPSLRAIGLRFRPQLRLSDPGLRQVVRLMGPAVIGTAAVQVNVFVNTNFASQITNAAGETIDGPVAWLGYAFRFMQLPLGLFGVAIASATLPAVSRSAAQGRLDDFRETLSRSLGLAFLLTIPSSVGLILLSRSIVGAIYQHGAFTARDTEQTALALSFYCLGLAGYAAIKILTPAFYALDDVRAPALTSLFSIAANYALCWTLVKRLHWGHEALALSTALVATLNFSLLFLFMLRKTDGVYGRRLSLAVGKIVLATALMGVAVYGSTKTLGAFFGESFGARLLDLTVSIPLGVAVLYSACRWLRVDALDLAERAIRQKLGGQSPADGP